MNRLIEFVRREGGFVHDTLIPDGRSPRVLLAGDELPASTCIFKVPQRLLLHGALAFQDPDYGEAFRALKAAEGPRLDTRSILCMLVVLERCKERGSRWDPYISFLPNTFDDPFWWGRADLQLLQGSRLGRAVKHYSAGLQQLAAWLVQLESLRAARRPGCGPGPLATARSGWGLTVHAAKWGRSVVWSRAFTVRQLAGGAAAEALGPSTSDAEPPEGVVALVPLVDMCDHDPDQRVVWHTGPDGRDAFHFVTQRTIPPGAPLVNNYGSSKPNEELILAYGFAVEGNPHDTYLVSIAVGGQLPDPSEGGEAPAEEEVQAAAELQQRRNLLAAAGLGLEHPISMAAPLPQPLLDAMAALKAAAYLLPQLQHRAERAAAAAQASPPHGALPSCSQPLNQGAHAAQQEERGRPSANGVGGSARSDGEASGGGAPPPPVCLFEWCPATQQMAVLLELQKQIRSKLAGLAHYNSAGPGPPPDSAAAPPPAPEGHAGGAAAAAAAPHATKAAVAAAAAAAAAAASNPVHARMARTYVTRQGQLLEAALSAVRAHAAALLLAASPLAGAAPQPRAAAEPAQAPPPAAPPPLPGGAGAPLRSCSQAARDVLQQPTAAWVCPGASLVDAPPCETRSLATHAPLEPGAPLLHIPLGCCVLGASREQLMGRLMLAAFLVRLLGQEQPDLGPGMGVGWLASAEMRPPVVLELLACGAADGLLDGTGAKAAMQQALSTWAAGFRSLQRAVLDSRPRSNGTTASSNNSSNNSSTNSGGSNSGGGGATANGAPHAQQPTQPADIAPAGDSCGDAVGDGGAPSSPTAPGAEPSCGASAAAGDGAADASGGGGTQGSWGDRHDARLLRKLLDWPAAFQLYCWASEVVDRGAVRVDRGPGGRSWLVLAPVLGDLPKAVRGLVLSVSFDASLSTICVAAATQLPAGLHLTPCHLLAQQASEEVLLEHGPRALNALHAAAAAPAASAGAVAEPAAPASGVGANGSAGLPAKRCDLRQGAGAAPVALEHLHDVTITPQEEDAHAGTKLRLMAAAGLGPVHLLRASDSLAQALRVLACMAISAASAAQLQEPAAQQLLASYGRQDFRPSVVSATAATPAADADAPAPASDRRHSVSAFDADATAATEQGLFLGVRGAPAAWLRGLLASQGVACIKPLQRVLRSTREDVAGHRQRASALLLTWQASPAAAAHPQAAPPQAQPDAGGGDDAAAGVPAIEDGAEAELVSGLAAYLAGLHLVVDHWLGLLRSPELCEALGAPAKRARPVSAAAGPSSSSGDASHRKRAKKARPSARR